mgnify:CR=1 FL=1
MLAKEAQGLLEMKINKLKQVIADAKIIDESKLKTDSVQILNKVELKNVKNGMKMTYTIVSESEANLKRGKNFCKYSDCTRFAWQESG